MCRRVNLRFGRGRKLDHFGITAVFEVEHAVIAPAVLVVADQAARGIGGQGGFARAGQPEEQRRIVAVGSLVGRAVHRHDAFQRQQVVHHREDRLLDLAGIGRIRDDAQPLLEVEHDDRAGARAVDRLRTP